MRVSNETKVGALTVIAVTLIILGFNFLRGKTIFKSGNFIYAKYTDTKGLIVSNPVFINGFQVGTVFEIENMHQSLSEILVTVRLNEPYKIPTNSIAAIQENPLGTNSISIVLGDAKTYFNNEDTIKTAPAASLLGDIMNTLSPLGEQTKNTISSLEKVLNNLNKVLDDQNKENFKTILDNLSATTKNLNSSMASIEGMLQKQNGSIAQSFDNINKFSKNLNDNNNKINAILTNLDSTSQNIKQADLNKAISSIHAAVTELNITLKKLNEGNGTAAKLMNDPAVYKELKNTITSLNTLVDDVKVHPKRYINISVFGKKDKSTPLSKPIADTTHE
ncbi:MAG: MCE family protein [Chitinophagia bacterium]|jgi:phospholipid/cholesterol/gamma-HCH transport system substrate-binding protein|nr:MCE family protein [Chitinophagia bacterium]